MNVMSMSDLELLAIAEEISKDLQFDPKRIRKILRWLDNRMMLEDHGKENGVRLTRAQVENDANEAEAAEIKALLEEFATVDTPLLTTQSPAALLDPEPVPVTDQVNTKATFNVSTPVESSILNDQLARALAAKKPTGEHLGATEQPA